MSKFIGSFVLLMNVAKPRRSVVCERLKCDHPSIHIRIQLRIPSPTPPIVPEPLHIHHLPLLLKHLSRALQHHLEALLAPLRVLPEPLDTVQLDLVLDALPAAAERRDFGLLSEARADGRRAGVRLVYDRLSHAQQLVPRQVHAAHGHGLAARVDVGDLVHERGVLATEDGVEPFRRGLLAGYEAFGAELVGFVSGGCRRCC